MCFELGQCPDLGEVNRVPSEPFMPDFYGAGLPSGMCEGLGRSDVRMDGNIPPHTSLAKANQYGRPMAGLAFEHTQPVPHNPRNTGPGK